MDLINKFEKMTLKLIKGVNPINQPDPNLIREIRENVIFINQLRNGFVK